MASRKHQLLQIASGFYTILENFTWGLALPDMCLLHCQVPVFFKFFFAAHLEVLLAIDIISEVEIFQCQVYLVMTPRKFL